MPLKKRHGARMPIKKRARPKMWRPIKAASALPLPPLKKNEYRSKLYGLMALQEISRKTGIKFLPFLVCDSPSAFSIGRFKNPSEGRLIVRTDPIRQNHTQTMEEWVSMPRLNLYLRNQPPEKSEKLVKQWMRKSLQKHSKIRFITHKVRPLQDYEHSVQLNVNLDSGAITISTTQARTDKFRDEKVETTRMKIDESGRLRREFGSPIVLPESLQRRTLSTISSLIRFAERTGHTVFEASFVTYRESLDKPEYYDLMFGKRM